MHGRKHSSKGESFTLLTEQFREHNHMTAPKYNAFETYQVYMALKNHFDSKSSYDFIKYNGKLTLKEETFRKRKDSKMFYKLSRKVSSKYMLYWMLSGFSAKEDPWIGDFIDGDMDDIYKKWKNRIDYLEDHYKSQFEKIQNETKDLHEFIKLFDGKPGHVPEIINYYESGKISFETLMIIEMVFKIFQKAKNMLGEFIEYTNIPKLEYKVHAYSKFFGLSKTKYKDITKQLIEVKEYG